MVFTGAGLASMQTLFFKFTMKYTTIEVVVSTGAGLASMQTDGFKLAIDLWVQACMTMLH